MRYDTEISEEKGLIPQLVSGSDVTPEQSAVLEPAMLYEGYQLDDSSILKLVHVSREGLPYKKFKIAESAFNLSKKQLADILHISDRTIDRIHKEKKRLTTSQTEKVLELSLLYEQGWEVFGDRSAFRKWLERPRYALGDKTPLSLLDTNYGIQTVKTLLGRIEHGIPA
ncbi:DUF2384 domain-containing protein [Dokdonia sinensis]|uniref:DUF2384 domain-containing protein n=1 Tax=Dokdonia sinensis TaxID=2479847 RepID=A0A3M0FUV9_9FLAO|nr:antitoxin Xre/MbcA/ParS toxin-binding domain-containing protein [Dokdonia sinensis]RMB56441.1 DUF2384 domain-containing protein [Dokdonia sinensis]